MLRRYLVFLLAVGTLAAAGPMSDALPRLTEDIVVKMLPVLRVQAAQVQAGLAELQEMVDANEEHTQLLEDIGSGKVDPLEWLKTRSKYFIAPPSAKYEQNLSRWVSSSYRPDPVALFSFGIDAPEVVTRATRDGEDGASFILSGQDLSGVPGGEEFEAVIDGVKKFYRVNKFIDDPVQYFFMYGAASPDTLVAVLLHHVNMFAGMPASEGVPDGPLLWLWLSSAGISAEAMIESRGEAAQASASMEEALARAGMTEESYQSYFGALAMAKSDAVDPSTLNIPLDASGLSAEQAELIKDMKDFYAIRRDNLKVYRKVASRVDPLLEALGQ